MKSPRKSHVAERNGALDARLVELDLLYQTAPIGLAVLDRDLRYVRVNDRLAEFTGVPLAGHLGRTLFEVAPELAEQVAPFCRQVLETGVAVTAVEYPGGTLAYPGPARYWLASYHPLQDAAGVVLGISAMMQDITERKQKEQALTERLRFEVLLADLSARFVKLPADAVDRAIEDGLQRLVEFLGVDRSTFFEFSADHSQMRTTHSYALPGFEPVPQAIMNEQFPWYTSTLSQGEIICMSRLPDDLPAEAAAERQYCQAMGFKSNLTLPITVGGTVVCALAIGSFRAECTWPPALVTRLRLLGEIFANALVRQQAKLQLQNACAEIARLKNRLETENLYLKEALKVTQHNNIVGQSAAIQTALRQVEQVAGANATVLLLGETGTGKELLARAIHDLSPRKDRPLIKVNCAALPPTLIEAELFGREKGAYTGALTRQPGRFELADGSTIFLDEIGELPLDVQGKLLGVLQEGGFERLGSTKTRHVDVRVIAATNQDLAGAVKEKRFREDLYYRLNVFPIAVPPLRERPEDIPLLVWTFVKEFGETLGKTIDCIPKKNLAVLQVYPWPGNIRELRNVIERAMILNQGTTLQIDLPPGTEAAKAQEGLTLETVERRHILAVLTRTGGRIRGKAGAAELLGLKPTTLYSRMEKLGIKRKQGGVDI